MWVFLGMEFGKGLLLMMVKFVVMMAMVVVFSSTLSPSGINYEGHGAWCWFKLLCLIKTAGHKVSCLDLASAGIDPSDPASILSLEDYDKPLFEFMKSLPKDEKVILVGHSAGGLSLTHMIHEFADKIVVAIYIAATMLPSGLVTQEDMQDGIPELSRYGDVYDPKFAMGTNSPPTSVALREEFQRKILYQLSPREDSTLASMLLRPWPAGAFTNARFGGEERVKQVRRVFIKTTKDHMVKPEQQDAMIRRWPPSEVLVINSDHSPFFSAPKQLFELIMQTSVSAHGGEEDPNCLS